MSQWFSEQLLLYLGEYDILSFILVIAATLMMMGVLLFFGM